MQNRLKTFFALCIAVLLLAGCVPWAPSQAETASDGISAHSGAVGDGQVLPPLTLLLYGNDGAVDNARGFYSIDVVHNSAYRNLLFFDYETLEQRYVCDVPGCAHDTPSCTSYIGGFGGVSAFAYGDSLYVYYGIYEQGKDMQSHLSALEKRTLDGKNPEIIYTWPEMNEWLGSIFTDGTWLYLATGQTQMVRLNMESYEHEVLATFSSPLQEVNSFGNIILDTSTQILPSSYQGQFLGRRQNVDGTGEVFLLHPATGEETLLHTWPPSAAEGMLSLPYEFTPEGKGYYMQWTDGEIRCYDIATDTDTPVTDFYVADSVPFERTHKSSYNDESLTETIYPAQYTTLKGPYDGWLFVSHEIFTSPETFESERVTNAYHVDTGTVSDDIPFRYYANGATRPAYIEGNTPHGLLVVNETRTRTVYDIGDGGDPFTTESEYWVYSLIDTEDFVAGRPNFRTIVPKVFGS